MHARTPLHPPGRKQEREKEKEEEEDEEKEKAKEHCAAALRPRRNKFDPLAQVSLRGKDEPPAELPF